MKLALIALLALLALAVVGYVAFQPPAPLEEDSAFATLSQELGELEEPGQNELQELEVLLLEQ